MDSFATIDEMSAHTEQIFNSGQATRENAQSLMQNYGKDLQRRIEAIVEANLITQQKLCQSSDMVRLQGDIASQIGFVEISFEQMLGMMTDHPIRSTSWYTLANTGERWFPNPQGFHASYVNGVRNWRKNMYEWFLPTPQGSARQGPEKSKTIGFQGYDRGYYSPTGFFRTGGAFFNRGPTFVFTRLNALISSIPYGAILRISEAKKTNLFHCFNIMTPIEHTTIRDRAAPAGNDPVIVGTIVGHQSPGETQRHRHFFIAKWD